MNPRSNAYQYKFAETACDTDALDGLHGRIGNDLYDNSHSQEFLELNDAATEIIFALARSVLTEHQAQVFDARKAGKTHREIKDALSMRAQSNVVATLTGKGEYGGAFKKLRKAMLRSEELRLIVLAMMELGQ